MKNTLIFNSVSILAAASRATIGDDEYMVVPVIGIREGVLNGIFYPESELAVMVDAWNGVPVPIGHPKNGEGNFVTANSADAEEKHNIGKFFDATFEKKTKALKGNLWINIEKAKALGHADLLDRLDKGENVDVSTGLWTNAEKSKGNYQGKDYSSIAREIRPDHLALLPNEKGACSVKDGCGTFLLNKDGEEEHCCDDCAKKDNPEKESMFGNAFRRIGKALGFMTNEVSHNELHNRISKALRAERADKNKWQYVVDVFDKFFVYEEDDSLFKQPYKVNADQSVEFDGDPVQVIVKRKYEELPLKIKANQKENMKPKHVTLLAAMLAANTISQEQHDSIAALPEPVLDDFLKDEKSAEPAPAAPVTNQAGSLSDADRQMLNDLKAEREQRITRLRTHLKANMKSLPETVIDTMTVNQLEETAASLPSNPGVANVTDFSLGAGAPTTNSDTTQKKYSAPSILLANKDEKTA